MTSPAATVTSGIGGVVSTVLSALGFGSQAASGPVGAAAASDAVGHAGLGAQGARAHRFAASSPSPGRRSRHWWPRTSRRPRISPLATPEQLDAERIATQTANSLPVAIMKLVLRQQFLIGRQQAVPRRRGRGEHGGSRQGSQRVRDGRRVPAAVARLDDAEIRHPSGPTAHLVRPERPRLTDPL